MNHDLFHLEDWQATPSTNTLRRGETVVQLEPKAMDVLHLLCQTPGEVVSADDIVTQVWGNTDIGDNPVHKVINQLRRALGDSASNPNYIETIRKRGYRIIAEVKFPLDQQSRAHKNQWTGESPFPGLKAFDTSDADIFFGRNEQVATLLSRIANQVLFGRAFCLILGPSGTGKSSLVNAGVLPNLLASNGYDGIGVVSHTSIDFADVVQDRLFVDLASTMLDWDIEGVPVFDGMSADSLAAELISNIDETIRRCHQALMSGNPNTAIRPLFSIFIDRLEVLLSSTIFNESEKALALEIIEKLATSGAVVVLSACRNDFYPLLVEYPNLMTGKANGSHFDLTAPNRAELSQMIRLPAVAASLTWATDPESSLTLDELLSAEAADNPDALPMLQYTLQELYLQRSDENELLVSVYRELGGIEGAIGKKAEEIYATLHRDHQAALAQVLSLLVTLGADNKTITSRAARWAQLDSQSQIDFVQAMVDSRLFISHLQNNEPCFSVAHEALLRRWKRASDWIATHRASLEVKGRIQELAERWIREGKTKAYLLQEGKPLQEALTLKNNPMFGLAPQEVSLIDASNRRSSTKRWAKRAVVMLLSLLTFTSVVMSYKSQQAEDFAQQKRLEAESLLGFMVGEFADKLRSVKRMDLLDGISNKALEYFSESEETESGLFNSKTRSFEARFQHAQTLEAMGEVAYSRTKLDEAERALLSAQNLLDNLYSEEPDNPHLLKILGVNAFWLGRIHYDDRNFEKAGPYFDLYRIYSQKLFELVPDDVVAMMELSYAYNTVGSLLLKQQKYTQAKNAFELSLELKAKALTRNPDDSNLLVDWADTLSWIASTTQSLGDLPRALDLHTAGQKKLEVIHSLDREDAGVLESLAYSHIHKARILNYQAQFNKSHANALRAIDILELALSQDPDNKVWSEQLLNIKTFSMRIRANLKNTSFSFEKNSELLERAFNKAERRPNMLIDLIKVFQNQQLWQESLTLIEKTSDQFEDFYANNKDVPRFIEALAQLHLSEARQQHHARNQNKKSEACNKAIQLLTPIVNKTKDVFFYIHSSPHTFV